MFNDADIEMMELAATANERWHARKHGYCLDCGYEADDPKNMIGELGLCFQCERDYLKEA
jgi:hypothetical protein